MSGLGLLNYVQPCFTHWACYIGLDWVISNLPKFYSAGYSRLNTLHREVASMIGLDCNRNYQLIGLNCNCIVMKYGALSILHTLLALTNFCFNQDNHKQTMHDVKFNINKTSCH